MMNITRCCFVLACAGISLTLFAQKTNVLFPSKVKLPNGWTITPVGKNITLGDLPLNMAVSHNKRWIAVTNNGQSTQTIDLIDVAKEEKIASMPIAKAWYGLAFSPDNRSLFVSGGNDNAIYRYQVSGSGLHAGDTIRLGKPWPQKISPAGMALDSKRNRLYVVTRENNSLYVVNPDSKTVLHVLSLGNEAYTCLLSADNKKLYISVWGGRKVKVYDCDQNTITAEIPVGSNPNEMCLAKNGHFLFVANANDNTVSVIDTRKNEVVETLNAALYPNAPSGSTTNGLALSENGKMLYIANADNNCLAVFDVSKTPESKAKGFIPVGWYPSNVKVVGKNIFVTNAKGLTSLPNPLGPNPTMKKETVTYQQGDSSKPVKVQYIAGLLTGSMSILKEPSANLLSLYSQQVYQNTPYSKEKELNAPGEVGNPIPMKVGDVSPIKHVFYVIKENRTYDQVLGDVKAGNGDTTLVLFGEKITPNQHDLVDRFVLLDNFYVDAEVSADGHNWSTGAYATDYLEKTWPTYYGGRGGRYDAEGNRAIANNRDGFIWDLCKRHNVTYRTYGEFADNYKPNIPVLKGHVAHFTGFDLAVRDTTRFNQWKADFDSLVAKNALPRFSTVRFVCDHTEGMRAGKPTPYAFAADNDLAVGLFVEHISKSPVWKESAIFIVEDDAQNGPDHVDAHRSPAYIVSPYVRRHFVDHTMYSTSGILRTMELILGLPPMTQYDAAATPLWRCFTSTPDLASYEHLPSNINLDDKNPFDKKLSALSDKFNWTKEDQVPDLVFNEILWQGLKNAKAPAPMRSAFLNVQQKDKDDD
ncbi:bifunctional YncE family protein/alkaline phosphatase family protein [Paludibacter sp.]|uniref:bifunctional YncE family protein/alkaline phosphatase family protein n=1 Tax=Paludibacter sp. TaxID=1898105 RepID=UPI0025E2D1A4|nr:bifunctional YncE family protein/alkaline phosphatase family protein [Paludibacter sp.]